MPECDHFGDGCLRKVEVLGFRCSCPRISKSPTSGTATPNGARHSIIRFMIAYADSKEHMRTTGAVMISGKASRESTAAVPSRLSKGRAGCRWQSHGAATCARFS